MMGGGPRKQSDESGGKLAMASSAHASPHPKNEKEFELTICVKCGQYSLSVESFREHLQVCRPTSQGY